MDFPALPNRLRETAPQERPQERLLAAGPAALSDAELVALLLRSGTRGLDVITLANRLLQESGSLGGLLSWSPARFRRSKGIGAVKAVESVADRVDRLEVEYNQARTELAAKARMTLT